MEHTQSPDKKQSSMFCRVVDVCTDTFTFITLEYILSSCRYSFRHNPVSILFFALIASLLDMFWKRLRGYGLKKWLCVCIIVIAFALELGFAYLFGILDIAPTLKQLA